MNDSGIHLSLQQFPADEIEKRCALIELFDDWQAAMREALPPDEKHLADGFVWDGFYPYYFSQPTKILFVGRESLGLAHSDYLDVILNCYRKEKQIGITGGSRKLNAALYHARMLHISYGVIHGFINWGEIPWAEKIGDTFASENGISFAMLNLSKLSNPSAEQSSANWGLINSAVTASGDFLRREVEILDPDVVVTMNSGNYLSSLGDVKTVEGRDLDRSVSAEPGDKYLLTSGASSSFLINTWHFSARKRNVEDFYEPICKAIVGAMGTSGLITPNCHPR